MADSQRVAVTGLSGGGWQTIILSSLDNRVTLSAPNAGYIGLESRARHRGDIGDIEQNPADLASIADYPVLTAMLAPRPTLLLYNENDDCCFKTERAYPSVYEPVKPLFEAMGVPEHLVFHSNTDPGTHNYDLDHRQHLYRFLSQQFFPEAADPHDEIPSEDGVRSEEELTVGLPEQNHDFLTLAALFQQNLPKNRLPDESDCPIVDWQDTGRSQLREVIRYDSYRVTSDNSYATEVVSGYTVDRHLLKLGESWTLPVVETGQGRNGDEAIVVLSDRGRSGAMESIEEVADHGARAFLADLSLMGECVPEGTPVHQFSMMFSAAGSRILGVQTGQLAAVASWVRQGEGGTSLRIVADGPLSCVVALCATAAEPGIAEKVTALRCFASLKQLTIRGLSYDQYSPLFCFGLLEAFDIRELIALAAPTEVGLRNPLADAEMVREELAPLGDYYRSLGLDDFHIHGEHTEALSAT